MNLNLSVVAGRLTRDPELKALPSGGSVASFSLATNRNYKDRDGNYQEQVEYHNIVVFGKVAENCAQFLRKGALALVEGRMQTRSWEKDGQKMYRTEVVADRVQFGPRTATSGTTEAKPAPAGATARPDYPEEEINPEDVPF